MRKYLMLFKTKYQELLSRKWDLLGNIITSTLTATPYILLWIAILQTTTVNYTTYNIIAYYLALQFLYLITYIRTTDEIAQEIRTGKFSSWLLKPWNILLKQLAESLAVICHKLYTTIPLIILMIIGLLVFRISTFTNIIFFIAILIPAILINFLLEYSTGLIAFWLEQVWFLQHIKGIITNFLSGVYFPLTLLPSTLFIINNWLPFRFILYTPISYLTSNTISLNTLIIDLQIGLIWILLLWILSQILFKLGVKKYHAYGG